MSSKSLLYTYQPLQTPSRSYRKHASQNPNSTEKANQQKNESHIPSILPNIHKLKTPHPYTSLLKSNPTRGA